MMERRTIRVQSDQIFLQLYLLQWQRKVDLSAQMLYVSQFYPTELQEGQFLIQLTRNALLP